MSRKVFAIALVVAGCLVLSGQAQTYKIKSKDYGDVGKKVNVQRNDSSKQMVKVSVMGMVVKDVVEEDVQEVSYTEIVVEGGSPYPRKFERIYTTAKKTKGGKVDMASHHGATVVFELQNGAYKASVKGDKALPPGDLKKLQKEANHRILVPTEKLLPQKAVAVEETWKVDPNLFAKLLADDDGTAVDASKSKCQAKLIKAYQKNGHPFGVIEYNVDMAVVSLGSNKLSNPIMFRMKVTIDSDMDGSSTAGTMSMTGSMIGKSDINQGGQVITIDLNTQMSGRQVISAEQ
jgi:hypothetical protein